MCLIATVILRKVPKILKIKGKYLKYLLDVYVCVFCVHATYECAIVSGPYFSLHPACHETNCCVYVWFN